MIAIKYPFSLACLIIIMTVIVACNAGNKNISKQTTAGVVEVTAKNGTVFVTHSDNRREAVSEQIIFNDGESLAVNEEGRAIITVADLMVMELLHSGVVTLQGEAVKELAFKQNGGLLLVDFNPTKVAERQLTIYTEFAAVTSTGGRFMIVHEQNSLLEWVVNLGGDGLQVTVAELVQPVSVSSARRIFPDREIGQTISLDVDRLQAWFDNARAGIDQPVFSKALLPPADMQMSTVSLTGVTAPGYPFELIRNVQGVVKMTLDPVGIFGQPSYSLEDCNGDGTEDIVVQSGKLRFDFRAVQAKVDALDVTVINRAGVGQGALLAVDVAGQELTRTLLEVGTDQTQTLSLRSGQPYDFAELALNDGCFLDFSLTPPTSTGIPAPPRSASSSQQSSVVVNIVAGGSQPGTNAGQSQLEAVAVGAGSGETITIDGRSVEWDSLVARKVTTWSKFETITYNKACSRRYPGVSGGTDLSGRVVFAYDNRFLYVAFRVNDDGYVGYTGSKQLYFLGDSPQLSLDMNLLGDYNNPRNQDDWQVDFLPNPDKPRAFLWQLGRLKVKEFNKAKVAVSHSSSGYFLEAALPWRGFNASPRPGDRLGIAANINDNDSPNTNIQECIISTAPQRKWDKPLTWGTLFLRPSN